MNLPVPKTAIKKAPTPVVKDNTIERPCTAKEVQEFMNLHGFSVTDFANFLGVTFQAVKLWQKDKREFSMTNSRLLRLLGKYPQLMKEFKTI